MPDVIFVVPDQPYRALVQAVHEQAASLMIGPYTYSVHVDSRKDAGVRKSAHEFARLNRYRGSEQEQFAIALFDHHGSGCNDLPELCEDSVETNLRKVTFGDNVACICVEPEIEQLVFCDLSRLAQCLGTDTQTMLCLKALAEQDNPEDLGQQFRFIQRKREQQGLPPRSLPIFIKSVDLLGWLADRSFAKLINTLRAWFPPK
jgi:hypothetical protein